MVTTRLSDCAAAWDSESTATTGEATDGGVGRTAAASREPTAAIR